MNCPIYNCVNCNLSYNNQESYKSHYKSDHHRYNIKRKLIGLTSLPLEEYLLQFQTQVSQSSVQKQLYCEICSKKFMSSNTYKQHLNSQKHKNNRKKLINNIPKQTLSKSSSQSQIQILGLQKLKKCMFCHNVHSINHLNNQHNFPPFKDQCIDIQQLCKFVELIIQQGQCIYCGSHFHSEESVKQHMIDVGHSKLDIYSFGRFQKFYLWKIEEASSQSEVHQEEQEYQFIEEESFEDLKHITLNQIQNRRQRRIKCTKTGVIINGKQVGYRHLRNYYKQYLGRYNQETRLREKKCLENGNQQNVELSKRSGKLDIRSYRNTIRTTTKSMNCR